VIVSQVVGNEIAVGRVMITLRQAAVDWRDVLVAAGM
jgi:hypothetical protein